MITVNPGVSKEIMRNITFQPKNIWLLESLVTSRPWFNYFTKIFLDAGRSD